MNVNPANIYCRVSKRAASIYGTSACLFEGHRLTVYDLLAGLMLPSGNDAARVLAEHFGRYFLISECRGKKDCLKYLCEEDPFEQEKCKKYVKKFVVKMN